MALNSRNKGKRGEREAAKMLKETYGVEARRGVQYDGSMGSPDVVIEGCNIHPEIKFVERINIYSAFEQAVADAKAIGSIPIVLHRKSRKEWLMVLRPSDLHEVSMELKTAEWKALHGK